MGVPVFDAILGGATSLVGSILGYKGQREANETNLQSVRETNQANYDLYREQYRDAYRLWQENNQYNTPANQMARLRQAGLNPALNMGSNPTGMAQAASTPSANPMVAGHVEPTVFNTSDIAPNIAALASASKSSEEAKQIGIDNQYRNQWNLIQIAEKKAAIKVALQNVKRGSAEETKLLAESKMLDLNARLFSETFDQQKLSFDLANDRTNAEMAVFRAQVLDLTSSAALKDSQAKLTNLNIRYQPAVLQASIQQALSAAQSYVAQAELSGKMSATEVQKATNVLMDSYYKAIQASDLKNKKEVYEATKDVLIQQANVNLFKSRLEASGAVGSLFGMPLEGISKSLEGLMKKVTVK